MASEGYIQTVLCNSNNQKLAPYNRHFILWETKFDALTCALKIEHISQIHNLGMDFGRKFDMGVDELILDYSDEHLEQGIAPSGE